MTLASASADITIDAWSGRVENATPRERSAIRFLRTAATAMNPFHLYGYSYVVRVARSLLPSKRRMVFVLGEDCRMRTDYCDAYWSMLLRPNYRYEPSIRALIDASRDVEYGFIDGGANHGFWSIIVSGPQAGGKKTIAVEAASDTFDHLADNCSLNGGRFTALNRAIDAGSGVLVRIYGAKHEARSIVAPSSDAKPILDCETISLDDLAARPEFADLDKFIVKLDLEGVEVTAFAGATKLLDADTAFIYEEHGSDRSHENTRYALQTLGLRVFWLGDADARELKSAEEVAPIKRSRRFGYDMVGTRSRFWIERLEQLVASGNASRKPFRN